MSGVEVAGLVFGVLPILFEAIKAYSTVSEGLHTFRHYSREVRSVALQLKVQNGIFLNHCRLLLRLVEDDKHSGDMLEDESSARWCSEVLNLRMNIILRDNVDICRDIIEQIKSAIEDMRTELENFDVLKARQNKDETIRSVIKRLRGAIKITFNKSQYERCVGSLRDRNDDLSVLRAQISNLQQQSASIDSALVKHKALPERFRSIQIASQTLHEALCTAWCCDDLAHRGHYAKLCLDAEVQTEVLLDIAISCHGTSTSDYGIPQEPPIWLHVQSMSMKTMQPQLTASQIVEDLTASFPVKVLSSSSTNMLKKKASSNLAPSSPCSRKKTKRVHFNNSAASGESVQEVPVLAQIVTPEFNLCQTKSICNYLKRNHGICDGTISKDCLGYLETPCQMYKHKFYLGDRVAGRVAGSRSYSTVYSIFDIMRQEADDVLEVEDQLKLAHKTASALLQYNETAWLVDRWRLSNMSYIGSRQTFDEAALKTLHLSSQIKATGILNDGLNMEDTDHTISDEIKYGINNLPLFFLGVALLEIAHWKPLESKMIPRDQEDQVFTARRLALGRAPLRPEYQKIAQKCLQCNFGFGTNLSSKSLQTAVYNDVVCELEGMIERLAV